MPGKEHCLITEHAIKLLDAWEREMLAAENDNLVNEYCKYPDVYFDVNGAGHEKSLPYYFETNGIQFHYIPDTPIVDKYRYWRVFDGKLAPGERSGNLNWKHASRGFTYYFDKSIESLKENRLRDAMSFAGCLLHMLQDSTFALHSLEGPYGTDVFVLDRLFGFDGDLAMLPSNLLCDDIPSASVTLPEYVPNLLGRSVPEAVFRLYSKYVHSVMDSRRISFQIVLAKRNGGDNLIPLYERMFHNSVRLCADVLHSIFTIAHKAFDAFDHLDQVCLSDLEPVERPWGAPGSYRFLTLLNNEAVAPDSNIVPLSLLVEGERIYYENGLSFGCHAETLFVYEIPKDVYGEFSCRIGLQTEYVVAGKATVELLNDGKTVFSGKLNSKTPSLAVFVEKPAGAFELRCSSPESKRSNTVITLAEPTLRK